MLGLVSPFVFETIPQCHWSPWLWHCWEIKYLSCTICCGWLLPDTKNWWLNAYKFYKQVDVRLWQSWDYLQYRNATNQILKFFPFWETDHWIYTSTLLTPVLPFGFVWYSGMILFELCSSGSLRSKSMLFTSNPTRLICGSSSFCGWWCESGVNGLKRNTEVSLA